MAMNNEEDLPESTSILTTRQRDGHKSTLAVIYSTSSFSQNEGVEINAHPLAKSRGMSRIFEEVVRQASGNFNVFCQLYMPTNGLDFLSGRSQRIVLEGASSDSEPVVSGIPQGTVLGPVLFLLYINDLPDVADHSTARLFADDCIVYRPIRNNDDTILLQNDLNKIAEWEFIWQMQFNIDKCFILRVGRPKHKLVHLYALHNQNLSETDSAKYLGLTITSDFIYNGISTLTI